MCSDGPVSPVHVDHRPTLGWISVTRDCAAGKAILLHRLGTTAFVQLEMIVKGPKKYLKATKTEVMSHVNRSCCKNMLISHSVLLAVVV